MSRDKYAGNLGRLWAVVQTTSDGTTCAIKAFSDEYEAETYRAHIDAISSGGWPRFRVQPIMAMPLPNE